METDDSNRSRARLWIWLALLLSAPLPFYALSSGVAPPVRLFFVASLVSGFLVSAPDFLAGLQVALYAGQGLFWSFVLYLVAGRAARLLFNETRASRGLFLALIMACVCIALLRRVVTRYAEAYGADSITTAQAQANLALLIARTQPRALEIRINQEAEAGAPQAVLPFRRAHSWREN